MPMRLAPQLLRLAAMAKPHPKGAKTLEKQVKLAKALAEPLAVEAMMAATVAAKVAALHLCTPETVCSLWCSG